MTRSAHLSFDQSQEHVEAMTEQGAVFSDTGARRWSCVGGGLRAVRPCSAIGCGGRWKGGV